MMARGMGSFVPPVAVLASGSGTTLQAVLDAVASRELLCRVNCVISDRPGAGALERGRRAGVPVHVVDRREYSREELNRRIDVLLPRETAAVVLAGYLSIVTEPLLTRFYRRMINIHPALLPDFGGAGMYGDHVHRAVLAAGVSRSGCTVHYVDHGTDTGEIILQRTVPVLPGDTAASLRERLRPVEHRAVVDGLAAVLARVAREAAQQPTREAAQHDAQHNTQPATRQPTQKTGDFHHKEHNS